MDLFRVRLNCVDHYQSSPTEFDPNFRLNDRNARLKGSPRVPVIRVFGSTETGQKVCAHVHGALPYLYIQYEGSLVSEDVNAYINRLHLSIDHALAVTYRRDLCGDNITFVAHITLIKGIPFYGFHVGYQFFFKIYMLDPVYMTRLADLLRQGAIMKQTFQPFESHLQFLLQWMCDYNLYGCGYIDCGKVKFRSPVPKYAEPEASRHLWHTKSIPAEMLSDETIHPRQSHCVLEVDVCAQDILNRHEIQPRHLHHDFIERLRPLSPDVKLVPSMAGLWRDETRRRKAKMANASPGSSPFPPEVLISMSADPRDSEKGGWIHEDEFRDRVKDVIRNEKASNDLPSVGFDEFVPKSDFEQRIGTAFESVADLFPENLHPLTSRVDNDAISVSDERDRTVQVADVDETLIRQFEEYMSDDFEDHPEDELSNDEQLVEDVEGELASRHRRSDDLERQKILGASQLDKSQSHDGTLQASPTRLDVVGIRDVDENREFDADRFDIPLDYTSDISTANAQAKRTRREGSQPRKRRRTFTGDARIDDSVHSNLKHLNQAAASHPGHTPSISVVRPGLATGSVDLHHGAAQNPDLPPLLSKDSACLQGSIKAIDTSRAGTLSFPVVKDPFNNDTIQRLSQRSGTSQKGSKSYFKPDQSGNETSKSSSNNEFGELTKYATSSDNTDVSLLSSNDLSSAMQTSFGLESNHSLYIYAVPAPSRDFVSKTLPDYGIPTIIYQDAYYSNERDVPDRVREYAGREFRLESHTVPFLPDFNSDGLSFKRNNISADEISACSLHKKIKACCSLRNWEIGELPPSRIEVEKWMDTEDRHTQEVLPESDGRKTVQAEAERLSANSRIPISQIEGPTQKNKHGFKYSQKIHSSSVQHEAQYMSTMSLEVHVNTRAHLLPTPEIDEVACIFWCIDGDDQNLDNEHDNNNNKIGIIVLTEDEDRARKVSQLAAVHVDVESTELDLINKMVDIVRSFDPDILTGYEVHGSSWGYLIERARRMYDYNLCDEFSRMRSQSHGRFGKENDRWGFNHTSTIRVTGRHMINIWRAMRGELNLLQYTMENVVFHLLQRRIPHYSHQNLSEWYKSNRAIDLAKVLEYYIARVRLDLAILENNELIPRTSEQARLLGVDFFSVFSRGSQFKVESLMFRIAKPENFLLISPSRKQVGQQNALECLPLVMEPQSAFYNSPLLVLDFQSLYPSVMIAYNYCYSTFLGRIVNWRGQNKMGFADYQRQKRMLELLEDHINIAPNGMMYVKPEIRKSLLAKMLGEILETRVMVKSGMKVDKDDKVLQRLLNNRQLALKLIANVTYGYTSASFSGRMPCSEIADSIVQTARETLERSIAFIHSIARWDAEVVYGDTDSLFVYLKGRSKDEAFRIGEEIAKEVTNMNPRPIKLKFEKVYFPCVLLAKKRYVGFKFESPKQDQPEFDAKGIETVRRDGTPAEQKIEEKALKILFRTSDLSQVKNYFQRQCSKIMKGSISIQDFCFAREVKLGTYSDRGLLPAGALISAKRMLEDPRAEPQYGERVPYVVITGAPGARLIDRCVPPETLLYNEHNELDAEYYISKNIIPPLERIFNLVGANVRSWYDEMPKFQRIRRIESAVTGLGKDVATSAISRTLESYMKLSACSVCSKKIEAELPICTECLHQANTSLSALRFRMSEAERKAADLEKICRSCAGLAFGEPVKCDSKDCPVFYSRTRHMSHLSNMVRTTKPMVELLEALDINRYDW
ncbi:putative DNA polymerase zeta catalytic subunit [Xylona heveae TC161]|uniref:DNA polymerase n=1 Tax=Xylona heveae (strain CBS 132557 / TC161) TaxID=1328760 RepID=A0A165AHM6_XYLHT|nr:putative DNA polymerase zeta catalytic subunit [Xylona heveae TC161]KZF20489.1 putative DNA polymerase zeta catalytic subunit [Xylona heveae TC161]